MPASPQCFLPVLLMSLWIVELWIIACAVWIFVSSNLFVLTSIISYPVDVDGLLPLVVLKHCLNLITVAFIEDVDNCNSRRRKS